jgi:hypothetical protein
MAIRFDSFRGPSEVRLLCAGPRAETAGTPVAVGALSPGMVVTDLLLASQGDWRARRAWMAMS